MKKAGPVREPATVREIAKPGWGPGFRRTSTPVKKLRCFRGSVKLSEWQSAGAVPRAGEYRERGGRYAPRVPKNPHSLTPKQIAVLEWVRDGTPDGVFDEGYDHRITARALERRGLVSIAGRGGTWRATLTTNGRLWLNAPVIAADDSDLSDADALLEDVAQAEGTLVLPDGFDLARYERLIKQSMKSASRPHGQRLVLQRQGGWRSTTWAIVYADYLSDLVVKQDVAVPERVSKYHPAVRAYLDDKDHHNVSKQHLTRAARLLHAIAAEALRRGLTVPAPPATARTRGKIPDTTKPAHLHLVAATGTYAVTIKEIPGRGGAVIEYTTRYDSRQPAWLTRRQTHFISTGRLELTLNGPGTPYDGNTIRDAKRSTVEDRLADFFAALDTAILQANATEAAAKRQQEQRQRDWEAAREKARLQFIRTKRWEHFTSLAADSAAIDKYRLFLERAITTATALPEEERAEALSYLEGMRSTIDELDPLTLPTSIVPTIADPTPGDLKPFMQGLNPWGPDR